MEFGGEKLPDIACRALRDSGRISEIVVQHDREWHPPRREADLLVMHDPSRALTPVDVIRSVVDTVATGVAQAAVPGQAVTDTIKVVDDSDALRSTWDRARLRDVQSPLCCRAELAADLGHIPTLDDLAHRNVRLVPGDPRGMRLRSPFDLLVAEALTYETSGHR